MAFAGKIKKLISILLLIILIEKKGGGLFLHNYFHSVKNIEQTNTASVQLNKVNYNCNCLDDFYLPFTEPVNETISFVPVLHQSFNSSYIQPFSIFFRIFNSLRAPPVSLA
jgi:hypothetical protein